MPERMPILQNLKRNAERTLAEYNPGHSIHDRGNFGRIVTSAIENVTKGRAAYFDIQVAADITYAQDTSEPKGVIRAPFDLMWLEFSATEDLNTYMKDIARAAADDAGQENSPITNVDGVGCFIAQPEEGQMFVTPVILVDGSGLMFTPVTAEIKYDKNGMFTGGRHIATDGEEVTDELETLTEYLISPAITALSLINCRNVETQETGKIGFARTGAEKRRGEPAKTIRYHTIVLPGGGTQSDGKGGHRATAVHRVRGHFKTFTPERPLLGRHTGTYWWGWQVRGNPEHGTIISDYKLA